MERNEKIDFWLMSNQKYLPSNKIPFIQERLALIPESKLSILYSMEFKDPTTILLVSVFVGSFGIDRFLIGDTGLGIGKLLTAGGCLVWWLVDLFLIVDRTKEVNFNKLMLAIEQYGR